MKLTIDFEPTAKGRPRIKFINGQAITYTPIKTQEAQDSIHQFLASQHQMFPPHTGLTLTVTFFRRKSVWLPKREKLPFRKPDLINFESLLCDAMSKAVIPDDAQLTTIIARKRWSPNGQGYIEIELTEDKLND